MIAYRVHVLLNGVIFPLGCFVSAAVGMETTIHSPWQSGRPGDYLAMLLGWPGFAPFLPLVVFSQVCLIAWMFNDSIGKRVFIRLGIYTGFLLSLQFLLFALMTSGLVSLVGAILVFPMMVGLVAATLYLPGYLKRFSILHLLILTTVVAVLIACVRILGGPTDPKLWLGALAATLMLGWQTIAMATPTLCAITFARTSIQVSHHGSSPLLRVPWISAALTWLVGWSVSWKLAVDIMLDEYSKLPASNPNCYFSSAAAHGHRWLVRTPAQSGVNLQMRRLKFLELVLQATSPRCHRLTRAIYDRCGPPLARHCQRTVWFADATYLLLKPIEYASEWLRTTLRIRPAAIERIYPAD